MYCSEQKYEKKNKVKPEYCPRAPLIIITLLWGWFIYFVSTFREHIINLKSAINLYKLRRKNNNFLPKHLFNLQLHCSPQDYIIPSTYQIDLKYRPTYPKTNVLVLFFKHFFQKFDFVDIMFVKNIIYYKKKQQH